MELKRMREAMEDLEQMSGEEKRLFARAAEIFAAGYSAGRQDGIAECKRQADGDAV